MIELYVALGVLAICLYFKWSCSHWRRIGNVDGPSPLPLFGNTLEQVLGTKHFGEIFDEVYKSYPSAAWVGIYQMFNKPSIVVRDLELVKDILIVPPGVMGRSVRAVQQTGRPGSRSRTGQGDPGQQLPAL
uniref:Probable cytochrome P450 308a1 n=1 Tax=Culex pipiens TaxID=7175 RepID=A0A8D8FWS3_CULPI